MSGTTTIYGLDDPAGRPLTALFSGPAAGEAAEDWASYLYAMRDTLIARAEESRKRDRNTTWRRMRFGDESERSIDTGAGDGP